MKKTFILACMLVFMLTTTAFAATWTKIPVDAGEDTTAYIDKASLQRGIHSAFAKVDRSDGFSVKLKLEMEIPGDKEPFTMINLLGFYTENGKKRMYYLEQLDENGNMANAPYFQPSETAADGTDGAIWPGIFDYLQSQLP